MNAFAFTFNAPAPNPRKSAEFILTMLREEVGRFPKFATPKKPSMGIMQAKAQRGLLLQLAVESRCDLKCLGTDMDELDRLVDKAKLLKERYFKREHRVAGRSVAT